MTFVPGKYYKNYQTANIAGIENSVADNCGFIIKVETGVRKFVIEIEKLNAGRARIKQFFWGRSSC